MVCFGSILFAIIHIVQEMISGNNQYISEFSFNLNQRLSFGSYANRFFQHRRYMVNEI